MASEIGFEPMHGNSPPNCLASSPLKPLGYLPNNINQSNYLFATLSILFTLCLDTQ